VGRWRRRAPSAEDQQLVATRTRLAVKLLGAEHKGEIERAIEQFVYTRERRYVPYMEAARGPRSVGGFGIVTPTLKAGANRVLRAAQGLRVAIYDKGGKLRDDVPELYSSYYPDCDDLDRLINHLSAEMPRREPARGRYDFDLNFAARLAGNVFEQADIELSLGRSPNNKFVKLTGIICGRELRGCPRACQTVIRKLRAARRDQPTK